MFDGIKSYIQTLHFQYELITALYMLEPWEKRFFNSMLMLLLATTSYSTVAYLPHYTMTMLAYFGIVELDEEVEL